MKRYIPFMKSDPSVAIIRLQGMIAGGSRGTLNDRALAGVIEKAFAKGKPVAVALEVNSPGGSPVQSSIAFVEDVAASGGYWLAAAADEIYADPSSVVGSIGVISASFGAHELLARQGVERRVYTAGKSKSMLDPFRPEKPEDVARLKGLLEDIHTNFIDHVQARRGDKLDAETELFTGEVWLAAKAKELGLIDGVGHLKPMLQERFGEKVRFRRYGLRRPFFPRLGAQMVSDTLSSVEERAAYAQFGL